ncbi:MAG: metallophosphoesterase family protein [Thermoplasmatota archaeon]
MDAYELAKSISEDQEFIYGISPQRSRDIEMFLQKCREHFIKRKEFPIVDLPKPDENDPYAVYFIGDTAGDVFSTIQLYKRFSFMKDRLTEEAIERGYGEIGVKLVFLGNYSGRPPAKLSKGGIQNLLFLLSLKMVRPDEVFLLRGNEEARELYDFEPFYLRKELERIFGRTLSEELIYHLYRIYDELPLFARTPNGIISSHAGFPGVLKSGIKNLKQGDNHAIKSTVWGDPQESGTYRGEVSIETNYNRYDFERFLEWSGSNLFIRAHDPRVKGYSMYMRRLLTVVSSSRYEEKGNGGIVVARALVHPDKEIKSVDDVRLRELEDFTLHEGRIPTWKA